MHELTQLIYNDMKPALGVTEPGSIALIMATAREKIKGEIIQADLYLNSGMYKNAFSCGIPNSAHTGNLYAAALGIVAGNSSKGLEALSAITAEDEKRAEDLVSKGILTIHLDHIGSDIYLRAVVKSETDKCEVIIEGSHTNLCYLSVNQDVLFDRRNKTHSSDIEEKPAIHSYTLKDIVEYAETVPLDEINFVASAYEMNLSLLDEGLHSDRTTFGPKLLNNNGGILITENERDTAQLLCNGAIEARVIGLSKPAMSITGSGAHGIICTMPLYGYCKVNNISDEKLYRATTISYLITQYIKEYSGKLSAFCGCGIAAGTGMACALTWLRGGDLNAIEMTIRNMAAGITGMICDGGNQGCTMKGIVACDAAFSASDFAMSEISIFSEHGICGYSPEDTIHYMGRIASPGMVKTEEEIVNIMLSK